MVIISSPPYVYIRIPPGTLPNNEISFEFEIWSKFEVLSFKIFLQYYCRDVSKILLSSVEYFMNKGIGKFHWISNSIEKSLVGGAPGADFEKLRENKVNTSSPSWVLTPSPLASPNHP